MHTQGRPEWVTTRDGRGLYCQVLDGPTDSEPATVLFEGGDGATRSSFAAVQPLVARFARAIVYDRSGMGRSPADPVSRTMDRMTDDLLDVVAHFAPGPVILVGHSLGGPIVRLAASRRPDLVDGLVLIDPSDEAADLLFAPSFRRNFRIALRVGRILAYLGLFRYLFRWLLDAAPADDVREDMRREAFAPGVLTTQLRQGETFLAELKTWQADPPDLDGIPVTVISGGLSRASDGMPEKVRAEATRGPRRPCRRLPGQARHRGTFRPLRPGHRTGPRRARDRGSRRLGRERPLRRLALVRPGLRRPGRPRRRHRRGWRWSRAR